MGLADRDYARRDSRRNLRKSEDFRQNKPHNHYKQDVKSYNKQYYRNLMSWISVLSIISFIALILSENTDEIIPYILTALVIIAIWTSYKSWMWKFAVFRQNKKMFQQLFVVITALAISQHVPLNTTLGVMFGYAIFIMLTYIMVVTTWIALKTINSMNLKNDLNCWGLRLVGALFIFGGLFLLMSTGLTMTLASSTMTMVGFYPIVILGICIIILGVFSIFRSRRRYGTFVYFK